MGELAGAVVTLVLGLHVMAAAVAVYLLPWFAALWTGHPDKTAIGLLNILLGWSFIGWAVALIWAFKSSARSRS